MFRNIKEILKQVIKLDSKNFLFVQIISIISAFLELFAIISFAIYINYLSFPDKLNSNELYLKSINFLGLSDNIGIFLPIFLIVIFFCSTFFSILTLWYLNKFSVRIGYFLGEKMFEGYLYQNWFTLKNNSRDKLFNNINDESKRVGGLIGSILQINLNFLLTLFLLSSSLFVNFKATLLGIIIFTIIYFLFFKQLQLLVFKLGKEITILNQSRINIAFQGLESIKEVLIYGLQNKFNINFKKIGERISKVHALNKMLAQSLRYILHFLLVFLFTIFVLIFENVQGLEFEQILPQIIFFALISLKIMPAFNNIYSNLMNIKGNLPAYFNLKSDINNFVFKNIIKNKIINNKKININKSIKIINFSFNYSKYKKKTYQIFNNSNFQADIGDVVYISGKSGSGKTTFLEILIRLLESKNMHYYIDGKKISSDTNLFKLFSYVPQKTFISPSSIEKNIVLDEFKNKRGSDYKFKLNQVVKLLGISDFLKKNKNNLSYNPGDMGIRLSGGQKQRIGIARALFADRKLIILDEATNALDKKSEHKIIKNIKKYSKNRILILVSHNSGILKYCNKHYKIINKKLVKINEKNK